MNRFFVVDAAAYDAARLAVDAAVGMPSGETCLRPAAESNVSDNGRVLVSVRSEHAEREPYMSAIGGLLASGAGQEVSESAWLAMFPPSAWPPS
jgi:hypothetical protein